MPGLPFSTDKHVIKQHIPLIASARSCHPFMRKLLRIWRSMVPVFRADREVVKACKEARRAHREALANDLDMALEYGDFRHAWELARLLANKTVRSVKPRPIPPTRETERHEMDAHMKKVFGADRTTNTGNIQDHAPPYQCGSMAEIGAMIPPLQKRARRLARYRAVPSWATPNEIHSMCLDGSRSSGVVAPRCLHVWLGMRSLRAVCKKKEGLLNCLRTEVFTIPKKGGEGPNFLRFINLLDGVGKMIFGGWLEFIEDPHRHWQFGFVRSQGVTDCLAVRWAIWAIWERVAKAGWCLSEQQWDIVKAFDMLDREQLFRDVTASSAPFVTDVLQDPHRQDRMHINKGRLLDSNGGASGRQLGSRSLPTKLRRCCSRVERAVGCTTVGSSFCRTIFPNGLPESSIDLSVRGYADDLTRAAVAKNLTELGQINREQTDSLRAALKSRSLQLHPTKGILLLRAAGRNSMKDYQAACTGAWAGARTHQLAGKVSWSASHD